jgi:transposase
VIVLANYLLEIASLFLSCVRSSESSQALLAQRARVVLACGDGLDNHAVAKKLRCSLAMVGKWRNRFLKDRLEGLYDEPRPGAPRKIGDDEVEKVIVQTLEATPRGQTHWSTRELAKTYRIQPDDHQPHLARLRIATAPYGYIQALARPVTG